MSAAMPTPRKRVTRPRWDAAAERGFQALQAEVARHRKRNPQDATLRNIRALKARVSQLQQRVKALERRVKR